MKKCKRRTQIFSFNNHINKLEPLNDKKCHNLEEYDDYTPSKVKQYIKSGFQYVKPPSKYKRVQKFNNKQLIKFKQSFTFRELKEITNKVQTDTNKQELLNNDSVSSSS
mmetsp:Transcript_9881/g.11167  ORF Transcript_9881/g.11167 Transcript_9881/m.11167 type:complete len:109 (+) Transcript_9881:202-528(+)